MVSAALNLKMNRYGKLRVEEESLEEKLRKKWSLVIPF